MRVKFTISLMDKNIIYGTNVIDDIDISKCNTESEIRNLILETGESIISRITCSEFEILDGEFKDKIVEEDPLEWFL